MIDINKELQDYWKAENALRNKIYDYLGTLNKKVDFYLRLDNTEEELHFIEIRPELLVEEHGEQYSYKAFSTGELLDIWDSLAREEVVQCIKI